ncbi:MAG: hypothetical protein JSS58_09130 [Proteobacteria bacterium]|nr:hypothetical protein [Pseudomonadota bacterium]
MKSVGKIIGIPGLFCIAMLTGCAPSKPYVYEAKENDPKLVLKSTGMPMNVHYAVTSNEENPCENFEDVGVVRDSGRGTLLPWIARLTEKLNKVPLQLKSRVSSSKPIYVSGYGKWSDGASKGSCGPIVTKFIPNESSTYLVEFVWEGMERCTSRVFDITKAGEKKAIPVEYKFCPRSAMSILFD